MKDFITFAVEGFDHPIHVRWRTISAVRRELGKVEVNGRQEEHNLCRVWFPGGPPEGLLTKERWENVRVELEKLTKYGDGFPD